MQAWATYAVDAARGLSVTVSTKNTGQAAAPYGTGVHPYLTVDGHPADSYELTVPASSALTTDASLIPTGRVAVDEAGVDFREPALIGGRSIDHAFTDIGAGGAWTASILHRGTGIGAAITADTPWVQVYSGEQVSRRGVAIEPMTCPPNAFNSHTDLAVLEPGQTHSMTVGIHGFAL